MTKTSYIYDDTRLHPIKAWVHGVDVETQAMEQIRDVASMPFIHKHVAVMPDMHWGMGAPIGAVIPTKGAIIPAAVGVDIGCGMTAVRTSLRAEHLPDNLAALRSAIEEAVPHGRTDNGGANDRGGWPEAATPKRRWARMELRYEEIVAKHPKAKAYNTARHMGTLGTGNHFIEVCIAKDGAVWLMLHSGSRGPGNKIGSYFIELAKREMERWFIHLPNRDLAYLVEGSELFDDYIEAVGWAQDFAAANREEMMIAVLGVTRVVLGEFTVVDSVVDCHHNYVERENHFGSNVWVTRKGAVRAREGDMGIIPGSMGERSFIVRGKGDADSFHSCSHGAGRVMSRGAARKKFTLEDHRLATEGVECRKDAEVIDETPGAYKNIEAVMAAQTDLVEIVHTLKQVVCVKG